MLNLRLQTTFFIYLLIIHAMKGMRHMDNSLNRAEYIAPALEALCVQCEEGFAVSATSEIGGGFSSEFDNQVGQWN